MNAIELLEKVSEKLVEQMTATGSAWSQVKARVGDTEIKVAAAIHGWSRPPAEEGE